MFYALKLSPHGNLLLEPSVASEGTGGFEAEAGLIEAFAQSSGAGLIALSGLRRPPEGHPAEIEFWRKFAETLLEVLAHSPEAAEDRLADQLEPPESLCFQLALQLPPMPGAEYASPEVLAQLWHATYAQVREAVADAGGGLKAWLEKINPALCLLGKVTFHLAENKRSTEQPFAFLATYTHRLTEGGKPAHLPLARALQEYVGTKNQAALNLLLDPVQKAADRSPWVREQLESRRIFQPQAWTPAQALALLRETPVLESAGVVVRVPDWWRHRHTSRPKVRVEIGEKRSGGVGLETLLSFNVRLSLGDSELTDEEWQALMQGGRRAGFSARAVGRDRPRQAAECTPALAAGAAGGCGGARFPQSDAAPLRGRH